MNANYGEFTKMVNGLYGTGRILIEVFILLLMAAFVYAMNTKKEGEPLYPRLRGYFQVIPPMFLVYLYFCVKCGDSRELLIIKTIVVAIATVVDIVAATRLKKSEK